VKEPVLGWLLGARKRGIFRLGEKTSGSRLSILNFTAATAPWSFLVAQGLSCALLRQDAGVQFAAEAKKVYFMSVGMVPHQ
jgi:hypothetical protein